jgi:hypothetical protein
MGVRRRIKKTMLAKPEVVIVPVAASVPSSARLFDGIWAPAVLIIGLVVTLAWTALLGYGLVNAIALAF